MASKVENILLQMETNDEATILMCNLYWELKGDNGFQNSVSSIAAHFGVSTQSVTKSVTSNCVVVFTDRACNVCGVCQECQSRTDFQRISSRPYGQSMCSTCREAQKAALAAAKQTAHDEKVEAIKRHYALKDTVNFDVETLDLESVIYLLAFIRVAATEDLTAFKSREKWEASIAPTDEYATDLLRELYQNEVIAVHPGNLNTEAFEFVDGIPSKFFLSKVWWILPYALTGQDVSNVITEIERRFREFDWPESWLDQPLKIWQKIALHECIEYLILSLEDHGFTFTAGEKTRSVLSTVLETYSVSQVFCMIWRTTRDAAALLLRGGVSKSHAANTTIGGIQRYAERAQAEGWDVKQYGRDRRLPQTMISQILFGTVLKRKDGFAQSISLACLESLESSDQSHPLDNREV